MKNRRTKASSLVIAAFAFLTSIGARADDWGCQVLLCMSNPAGPMAVAQCVPPITRLYNCLAQAHPCAFPTCSMAGSPGQGGSWASFSNARYDICPAGTTSLASGQYAVKNGDIVQSAYNGGYMPTQYRTLYRGTDDGAVCVGNSTGTVEQYITDDNEMGFRVPVQATIYDNVLQQTLHLGRGAIDIYINGMLHNRVFW